MIDRLVNFFFGCRHRKLSRPLGAISDSGVAQGVAYVVCLDCGKHFAYDTSLMKMGKEIKASK